MAYLFLVRCCANSLIALLIVTGYGLVRPRATRLVLGIRGEIVELADRKRRRSTAALHEDTAYCTLINATVLRSGGASFYRSEAAVYIS